MSDYYKALQFSLAFHALLCLALFSMGNPIPHGDKMLVIDFTLEDHVQKEDGGKPIRAAAITHTKNEEENKKDSLPEKSEVKEVQFPDKGVKEEIKTEEALQPAFEYNTKQNETNMLQHSAVNTNKQGIALGEANPHTGAANTGAMVATSGRSDPLSFDVSRSKYLKEHFLYIREMINKKVTYPTEARQKGLEGKVKLSFIILQDGSVKGIHLMKGSGYSVLDNSAVEAVKNASPFPKPPAEAQILIPIVYKLH